MRNDLEGRENAAIARRLIATREALGMNQSSFAAFCGITPQTLNNFEKALQRPSLESAGLISAAIGAKLDWLYYGDRPSLPTDLSAKIFAGEQNARKRA